MGFWGKDCLFGGRLGYVGGEGIRPRVLGAGRG